jgi:hypothetical protein
LEDGKACLQYGRDATEFFRLRLKASDVESQIEIQRSASLYHLMSMMEILHSLFESDGLSRPMTMVAIWMKKSFQVWIDW